MIRLEKLNEEGLKEISWKVADAFYDYQYSSEDIGLVKYISSRENMFTYMHAIVKAAYNSGMLYTTSENHEGFLVLSGKDCGSVRLFDGLKMIAAEKRALGGFSNMKKFIGACFSEGGTIETRMRKAKRDFIRIEMLVVCKEFQGKGFMKQMLEYTYDLAKEKNIPVILDTDDKNKALRYEHLGMTLDKTRNCGEKFHMYDLIKEIAGCSTVGLCMETYLEKVKRLNKSYNYQDIDVDGITYHYLIAGEPNHEVIALLNGGMNSHEMWVDFIEHLSQKYRVISFDYPRELKTINETAAGIIKFLTSLGITECYFTGASFGGYMAQEIARERPDMVKGLFLHATGAMDADTITDFRKKYFLAPLLMFYMKHCNYDKRFKPLIVKSMDKYTVKEGAEVRAYIHDMAELIADKYTREKDIHVTSLLMDIMNQKPVTASDFSSISQVVMILPSDDFFTAKQQDNLKSVFPQAHVVCIEGGHMSTITRAEEFVALIDKTISGV